MSSTTRQPTTLENITGLVKNLNASALDALIKMLILQRDELRENENHVSQEVAQMVGGDQLEVNGKVAFKPITSRSPMFKSSPVNDDDPAIVDYKPSKNKGKKKTTKKTNWRVVTKKKRQRNENVVDINRVIDAFDHGDSRVYSFCGNDECRCCYIFHTNKNGIEDPAGDDPSLINANQLFYSWSKTDQADYSNDEIANFVQDVLEAEGIIVSNLIFPKSKNGYGFFTCKTHDDASKAQKILRERVFTVNFAKFYVKKDKHNNNYNNNNDDDDSGGQDDDQSDHVYEDHPQQQEEEQQVVVQGNEAQKTN